MPTGRGQRIATGEGVDAAWFHEFYEDVLPVVYGYFFNRCGGRRELAADLTQETFASALVSLRNGATPESPRQWIITIARRRLIDHIRRRKPTEPMGDRDPEIWVGSGWATETEARLVEALDLLREDHRLALILRYVDDLPISQVADAMGRSSRATESLLVRARAALSENFETLRPRSDQ